MTVPGAFVTFTPMRAGLLRWFLAYVRPYRFMLAASTACGILKYNIPIAFPWVLKDVIDRLLAPDRMPPGALARVMLALLALYGLWAVITYWRFTLADRAGQRIVFDLRQDLFAHLQRLSLGFHDRHRVGALAARVIQDISTAQNIAGAVFTNAVMDASALFLISGLLLYMNPRLALVALSILPCHAVLNRFFQRRIRSGSRQAQERMDQMAGAVHEKLRAIATVQGYAREKTEERLFFQEHRRYFNHLTTNIHNNAAATAATGLLTAVAPILVVWYGGLEVLSGRLTVGALVAFYAYLGMLYTPLNRLTELNVLVANALAALERVHQVFATAPEVRERPGACAAERAAGAIAVSDLHFAYAAPDGRHDVLHGISLSIPAGTCAALVGPSGSGKSTLARLIPRFYDVRRGAITLDGRDIRDLTLQSLRRQIALVPQEPILFSGTVADNIGYGRPNATPDAVVAAACAANADAFIRALPQGYATEVGENGLRLSAGQRQRVALARAFLKDAPILILDEPTAAQDGTSEAAIQEALARLRHGRTTIVIAHRLATVRAADRIFVFETGRVVENGTPAELLARPRGRYRQLCAHEIGVLTP